MTVAELAEKASEVVDRVIRQGEHVVITDGARRLAILAPHGGPLVDRRLDKAELGFDPDSGLVGSASGRETVLRELREAGLPLARTEGVLDEIYPAVLELCEEK